MHDQARIAAAPRERGEHALDVLGAVTADTEAHSGLPVRLARGDRNDPKTGSLQCCGHLAGRGPVLGQERQRCGCAAPRRSGPARLFGPRERVERQRPRLVLGLLPPGLLMADNGVDDRRRSCLGAPASLGGRFDPVARALVRVARHHRTAPRLLLCHPRPVERVALGPQHRRRREQRLPVAARRPQVRQARHHRAASLRDLAVRLGQAGEGLLGPHLQQQLRPSASIPSRARPNQTGVVSWSAQKSGSTAWASVRRPPLAAEYNGISGARRTIPSKDRRNSSAAGAMASLWKACEVRTLFVRIPRSASSRAKSSRTAFGPATTVCRGPLTTATPIAGGRRSSISVGAADTASIAPAGIAAMAPARAATSRAASASSNTPATVAAVSSPML